VVRLGCEEKWDLKPLADAGMGWARLVGERVEGRSLSPSKGEDQSLK
jgi:hypothetical protein